MSAQSGVVRGNVKDETGIELIGATVAEIDKNDRVINGSITDINGNYVLPVTSLNGRIQFSFIGYKTLTFEINGRKTIDMQMEPNASLLDAVEIVAERQVTSVTGISDQNRVGAVSKLEMTSLEGEAISSASDALQGQVAGLDIVSTGTPGETGSIVIRGLSSIGDATPLVVIDGIAQQSFNDFDFASADVEDLSALLSVPTQDIKAIRVLKDATECAVWGSRGANGVIEIDTHQGSKGKTRFTYSYKYTRNTNPKQIPMLNGDEYIMMQQEQLYNRYGLSLPIPDEIAYDPEYVDFYNYNKNTNWYDEITHDGFTKEHGFKVDGGGDNTNYYVSLNTFLQEGQVENESLDKLNARVNLTYNISKKVKLTARFSYLNHVTEGNAILNGRSVLQMSYIKAPNMAVYLHDENGSKTDEYFNPVKNYQGAGDIYFNPVAVVNLSQRDIASNQLNSDFILQLNLHQYLTFKETVSVLNKGTKTSVFIPQSAIGAEWNSKSNNSAKETNQVDNAITSNSLLIFAPPKFGEHKIESSFMWETTQTVSDNTYSSTALNMSSTIDDPAANAVVNGINSEAVEIKTLGLLGMVSYKYKNRYIVTSYLRADANSRFVESNRWGVFPSIGAKWVLADEPFMHNVPFISRSDFSLSWGRVGNIQNSIKAYSRHGIYDEGGQYLNNVSIVPIQPQLNALKWEEIDEINSSLDLGLWKNRLSVLLQYYNKTTSDVAWENYPIPTSSGYSQFKSYNGGTIKNVGYDVTVKAKLYKQKDLSVILGFNINNNQNWFESLPANQSTEKYGNSLTNMQYPLKTQLGSPIGSIFGLKYLGVYSTDEDAIVRNADGSQVVDGLGNPIYMVYQDGQRFKGGDAIYEDINHDGVININDAVYLGHSAPKLVGGFDGTMKYKGFQLRADFIFRSGLSIVNQIAMDTENMIDKNNQSKATLYRWRKQGDEFEGMIPRAYQGHQFNSVGSDRYVEDGTFLKLNSLTLSYAMSSRLKERIGVSDCRISFSGRKLVTWSNYGGQNPEIATKMTDRFWIAKDNGRTPPPRTYSVVFSVTL